MKKFFVLIAVFLCVFFAGAQEETQSADTRGSYRIIDVEYDITGATQAYALALNVPIDTNRVFATEAELQAYIADIQQQITNLRVIASVETSYSFLTTITERMAVSEGSPSAVDIIPVVLKIATVDTFNFIIVPYPKYDSNSGLDLRLKFKNYNFFGTMETLTADIIYLFDTDDNTHSIGANLDFDLPFKLSIFDVKWLNDYSLDYTFGKSKPEFGASTGLEFTLPFELVSLVFTIKQSADLDFDYYEGDQLYFTENASIAIPIEIADINSWTKVHLTPDVHAVYHWDADGITDPDLLGPVIGTGYTLSSSRVNWIENYRSGFSFEFGQKFDYNYNEIKKENHEDFIPSIWAELELYRAFKYLSFNTRMYLIGIDNGDTGIGDRLRGIKDDQNGIDTPLAFVANFDFPVKVLQTDWMGWGKTIFKKEMPHFFSYLDFEMQISPFIDIAFSHIVVPDANVSRSFNYKDGWYAGGLEILVYPNKMRSLQGRVSFGVDLARTLGFLESRLDTTWRSSVSKWELFIGIGLFY
jgi:hypothetical protein